MDRLLIKQEEQRRRFEAIVRGDADLVQLLNAARELRLPQWRIVAGCLYQTTWNVLTNKPARTGIKDYDLIYFDDSDLSWQAEDQVVKRVNARMSDLPAPVEVRNQARVHLWFKKRFGADYAPLRCADESLARYASIVHALGVRLEYDGCLDIVAPFGFDDLFNMVIRPNRAIANEGTFTAKAARAKAIWQEVSNTDPCQRRSFRHSLTGESCGIPTWSGMTLRRIGFLRLNISTDRVTWQGLNQP